VCYAGIGDIGRIKVCGVALGGMRLLVCAFAVVVLLRQLSAVRATSNSTNTGAMSGALVAGNTSVNTDTNTGTNTSTNTSTIAGAVVPVFRLYWLRPRPVDGEVSAFAGIALGGVVLGLLGVYCLYQEMRLYLQCRRVQLRDAAYDKLLHTDPAEPIRFQDIA
jgi:hypothetical protein